MKGFAWQAQFCCEGIVGIGGVVGGVWWRVVYGTDVGYFFGGEETHFCSIFIEDEGLERVGGGIVVDWWEGFQRGEVSCEGGCERVRWDCGSVWGG